jgi:hypothetical protein
MGRERPRFIPGPEAATGEARSKMEQKPKNTVNPAFGKTGMCHNLLACMRIA